MPIHRRTHVVDDPTAWRAMQARLARAGALGDRILTLDALAARLAGGFLRAATAADVRATLHDLPRGDLRALRDVADLPGFADAATRTLTAAWRADLPPTALAADAPDTAPHTAPDAARLADLATLHAHVVRTLPAHVLPPTELVARALENVHHADALLGPVTLHRVRTIPPVHAPLLTALAEHVDVTWVRLPALERETPAPAGVRTTLDGDERPSTPPPTRAAYADPAHEVRAALRWLRAHLEAGVPAHDLAIAALDPAPYDDLLIPAARRAGLPLHVAHRIPVLHHPAGQLAAALADALRAGPSRARLRRLLAAGHAANHAANPRAGDDATPLARLPLDWDRPLHPETIFGRAEHWPYVRPHLDPAARDALDPLVDDLARGLDAAHAVGERWLRGRAHEIWTRALDRGRRADLLHHLEQLRDGDDVDPESAALWSPAEPLLATPRPHVRLLGLASGAWPRDNVDDPLLPAHLLGGRTLEDPPRGRRDRGTFQALRALPHAELVLSRPRADAGGKAAPPSPLLRDVPGEEVQVPADAPPTTPYDDADRRAHRPADLARDPARRGGVDAFRARQRDGLTAYDGVVPADHPALTAALAGPLAPSKLVPLLRDPFRFVGETVLRWAEPPLDDEPLDLDARTFGTLVHDVLERVTRSLAADGVAAHDGAPGLDAAFADALHAAAARFTQPGERDAFPPPPATLWRATLRRTDTLARRALALEGAPLPGMRSDAEVRFGLPDRRAPLDGVDPPWPPDAPFVFPGTRLRLRGVIDRLDRSDDGTTARVTDYKTGASKPEKDLAGGREVQRVVYAAVARAHLDPTPATEARLIYPRGPVVRTIPADRMEAEIARLGRALAAATEALAAGGAVPGADGLDGNVRTRPLRLALPADAKAYGERIAEAVEALRADVADAWADPPADEEVAP